MVVNDDAERCGGGADLFGHVDIGAGGRGIAGWVVADHPYGPHNVLIYMIYFA